MIVFHRLWNPTLSRLASVLQICALDLGMIKIEMQYQVFRVQHKHQDMKGLCLLELQPLNLQGLTSFQAATRHSLQLLLEEANRLSQHLKDSNHLVIE